MVGICNGSVSSAYKLIRLRKARLKRGGFYAIYLIILNIKNTQLQRKSILRNVKLTILENS